VVELKGTLHEKEHHSEMCAAPDGSGRLDD
jgi:hypothetical protein